ncbi:MAG: hypothetical protein DI585_05055 [Pseudomonas fluorescens]|nr:MAG: hypothetical protein DI585_05055 [Pseudomonas fluorescens]
MSVKFLYIAIFALIIGVEAHAQERAASGSVDTQMTWTALKTAVGAVEGKADAVNARVDQIVVCGRKGMVYAPGDGAADAQGCKSAVSGNQSAHWDINNGYAWAGQVLIQWGIACPPAGGSVYVGMPTPFPHSIMNVVSMINEPHYGATRANQFARIINANTIEVGKAGMNGCINWRAIGF